MVAAFPSFRKLLEAKAILLNYASISRNSCQWLANLNEKLINMACSAEKMRDGNFSLGLRDDLQQKVEEAANVVKECTKEYRSNEIFLSFNGGKDCTALLHLYLQHSKHCEKPIVVYIQPEYPFEEVDEFIKSCEKTYCIDIRHVRGNLKATLEQLCNENPNLKSVVMGCRRTDPYCENLQVRQYTDPGWPKLLRVNPLLDWSCSDIWDYLRTNQIEYCSLYDEGYTSIGDVNNTKPNEHLRVQLPDGSCRYRPAWELKDDSLERWGRRSS